VLSNEIVQELGGLLLVPGQEMAVAVDRDRDRGVAHVGGKSLGVYPCGDHEGGIGVARLMETQGSRPCLGPLLLARAVDDRATGSVPESSELIRAAETKVLPFLDEAEAEEVRSHVEGLKGAEGDPERGVARDALRETLRKYSYLL
jgi:hypothetical protein